MYLVVYVKHSFLNFLVDFFRRVYECLKDNNRALNTAQAKQHARLQTT